MANHTMPEKIWATEARPGRSPALWSDEKWPVYDSYEYVRADVADQSKVDAFKEHRTLLEHNITRIIEPAASGYTKEYHDAEEKARVIVDYILTVMR
jgi:hypothetical protein